MFECAVRGQYLFVSLTSSVKQSIRQKIMEIDDFEILHSNRKVPHIHIQLLVLQQRSSMLSRIQCSVH